MIYIYKFSCGSKNMLNYFLQKNILEDFLIPTLALKVFFKNRLACFLTTNKLSNTKN